MKLFRELSEEEEKEFKQWARDNYTVFEPISGIWHPIVQKECTMMNEEAQMDDQLKRYEKEIQEWRDRDYPTEMHRAMSEPNKPGYFRANND